MNFEQDIESRENANPLVTAWKKYFPYWPLFLLLMVLTIAGAWIYLKVQSPVYQSTATLLLKDEKKGLEDSKTVESLNPLSQKKILDNEIEVIKSRELVGQVVKELLLYAPITIKDKWKKIPAYGIAPFAIQLKYPDSLIETKEKPIFYNSSDTTITIDNEKYPVNTWVDSKWGSLKFVINFKNRTDSANAYQFALINPKRVVKDLIDNIDVVPVSKLSSVVTLKYSDISAKRSEDILSGVVKAYASAAVTERSDFIENTLAFLDARLGVVSKELKTIETRLQQYKANEGAIDVSSQGQLFLKNVSDNDQLLSDVNMKLAMLEQVERYVNLKDAKSGLVPSTLGISDPFLSGLLEKLYDSELEYERLKRTTAENNPMLVSIKDAIEKLRPAVLENILSQKRSLEASKANLNSTNQSYSSVLQTLPKQERDLLEINREQIVKSSIYNFLLQKKEETDLSRFSSVSDMKIVDKAQVGLEPISNSKAITYFLAVALALGIGVLIVLLKESLNSNILFSHDLEQLTPYPIISELMHEKRFTPIVLNENHTSFIGEQFRMLRNSVLQTVHGSDRKRILITSSISGDGKSFVSTNLALSLAMGGKKVVLIDYDLTNPTLMDNLNMQNDKGVSEFLSGSASYESVIYKTSVNNNLYFIPAGTSVANSSDLIMSEKTQELLSYLDQKFDYIIIDSAPLGILSDSYILSRLCQCTLYVVRHNHTPKRILKRLEQNNKNNGIRNISLVFNGIRPRGFGGNTYGNGYAYGYLYRGKDYKQSRNPKLLN